MKTKLTTALALLASSGFAWCQVAQNESDSTERLYLDTNMLSVSYGCIFDLSNELSVDTMHGGVISIGYSFGETKSHYWSAYFKTGFFSGNNSRGDLENGDYPNASIRQTVIPIALGYTYHQKFSDKFSVYAGLEAGFTYSSSTLHAYDPSSYDPSPYDPSSKDYQHYKAEHTKLPFTLGCDFGFTCTVNKNLKWETGVSIHNAFGLYKENPNALSDGGIIHATKANNAVFGTFHTGIIYTF